jgi:hypothetical protein
MKKSSNISFSNLTEFNLEVHKEKSKRCNNVSIFYHSISMPDNVHQLHVQQPSTYEKPEAASAVLGA